MHNNIVSQWMQKRTAAKKQMNTYLRLGNRTASAIRNSEVVLVTGDCHESEMRARVCNAGFAPEPQGRVGWKGKEYPLENICEKQMSLRGLHTDLVPFLPRQRLDVAESVLSISLYHMSLHHAWLRPHQCCGQLDVHRRPLLEKQRPRDHATSPATLGRCHSCCLRPAGAADPPP